MNEKLLDKIIDKILSSESNTPEIRETENVLWTENIWKYVILRGYDSWVHFGKLEFASKWLYRLSDSRRLWYWKAKQWIWLTSVALYWLKDDSKICWVIQKIEITDERISEIIPCSDEAIKNIQKQKEYNP